MVYVCSSPRGALPMADPGRPTLYRHENAERAQELCMVGATNRDLAERFGVARSTIDHWIATIPEFGDAVRMGRECADISVVKSLFNRALGFRRTAEKVFHYRGEIRTATYNVHVDADVRACIFWLRNRQRRYW